MLLRPARAQVESVAFGLFPMVTIHTVFATGWGFLGI